MKATWGKIAGAIGLVLVLSSPFTFFVTSGSGTVTGVKAALGVVLIGVFFATNLGQLGQFASGRSTFYFATSALTVVAVLGLLVGVNFIAARKNKSWDLTDKRIHSLSPQTLTTLENLPSKVRAVGFVATDHPYYGAVEDLFQRYHAEAPDKFEYSFKDPLKHPDLAAKYQLRQGQTTLVLALGEGETESHTRLNAVSEQDLTNALIKLSSTGAQKTYFLVGHGEWSFERRAADDASSLSELRQSLEREGYTVDTLGLAGKDELPADANMVVIAGARQMLSPGELAALGRYLEQGGHLLVFAEPGLEPGLDELLAKHGVELDPGVLADARFRRGSPYSVLSVFYGEHEIAQSLAAQQLHVEFPRARGLSVVSGGTLPGVEAERVVLTSPYAWGETEPNENPEPSSGEKTGQIPMVVASRRPIPEDAPGRRSSEARLVVFGDSELLLDANWGHEGNRNLVLNAFGWASAQPQKVTIRPPDRDLSTLDMDGPMLSRVRFVATDVLPLTLLAIGLAIWLKRRNQ